MHGTLSIVTNLNLKAQLISVFAFLSSPLSPFFLFSPSVLSLSLSYNSHLHLVLYCETGLLR